MRDDRSLGFRAWEGDVMLMREAHLHTDVEWNFVLRGSMTYFLGGRFVTVPQGRLCVFWAGVPHRLVSAPPNTHAVWVTLPLAWLVQWKLDERFMQRLLRGQMVREPSASAEESDRLLLARWTADFKSRGNEAREVAALEVQSRLRRLALALRTGRSAAADLHDATPGSVQRLTEFIGRHYREDVSVADVAAAAKLHPNYAMQLFKRSCGMSIWEYLTRLRVSHAQRLLLTTDWKVHRVALESGFNTPSRFYEAFVRFCRRTPRKFRMTMRGGF